MKIPHQVGGLDLAKLQFLPQQFCEGLLYTEQLFQELIRRPLGAPTFCSPGPLASFRRATGHCGLGRK